MASTDRQRWARVPPHKAWQHPGLPREWTPVLERNEEAIRPEPLPGYVWLEAAPPQNKRFHAWAAHWNFAMVTADRRLGA
jgi:hypothetical protein